MCDRNVSPSVTHSPKSRLIQLKKEKLEYTPGEHEHGLFPAPIHVGGYFTCFSCWETNITLR